MSGATEREIEAAEAVVEQQRDDAVARIRGTLTGEGEDDCVDCAAPIGAARKAALPSADRCITCQTIFERRARGH